MLKRTASTSGSTTASLSRARRLFSTIPRQFSARTASCWENSGGTPSEPCRVPCCWLSTCIAWRVNMTKRKPSASSRRVKLTSVSADSIFSKPANKEQKAVLSRIAKRQAAGDDSGIDYSDIPPLTDAQLAQFRRAPKVLVAARLDKEVYDWLMQYGKGYSSRINGILRTVMERTR